VVSTGTPQYYAGHIKKKFKKAVFFNEVYMDLKMILEVQK
jgi:hypothetical protein